MLDERLPTWAAKQSNNVGSSKVVVLNPSLFDGLATAQFRIIAVSLNLGKRKFQFEKVAVCRTTRATYTTSERHKTTIISLVKGGKILMLHMRHAFSFNELVYFQY